MKPESLPLRKLPLELSQRILLYLDIESFYAATLACRTWRHCALAHYILRKQLESTPMRHSIPEEPSCSELQLLFNDISRTHLLGLRVVDRQKVGNPRSGCANNVLVWSHQGILWAEMRGLDLKIASSLGTIQLQLDPSVFPRPEEVSKARQWFHSGGQVARYQIALSAKLDLVAVALGNKIHIYPVRPEVTSNEHVEFSFPGTSLNWAQSIEFAESDTLLRCEINRGGAMVVQYRGFGPNSTSVSLSGVDYWKAALSNVYLSSDTIPRAEGFGLRGVRLLPQTGDLRGSPKSRFNSTKSFVAVIQHENQTSYGLCTHRSDGDAVISWKVACQSSSAYEQIIIMDDPRWNPAKLPFGECHKPILAISDDGLLLAIIEQPSNIKSGALYICPLLTHETGRKNLPCKTAPRWPLYIDVMGHNIINLRLTRHDAYVQAGSGKMYTVEAQSYGFNFKWSLTAY